MDRSPLDTRMSGVAARASCLCLMAGMLAVGCVGSTPVDIMLSQVAPRFRHVCEILDSADLTIAVRPTELGERKNLAVARDLTGESARAMGRLLISSFAKGGDNIMFGGINTRAVAMLTVKSGEGHFEVAVLHRWTEVYIEGTSYAVYCPKLVRAVRR